MKINKDYWEKLKRKFELKASQINEEVLRHILKTSYNLNVNPEIVFAFIIVEVMNRGGILNNLIESTLVKLFPFLVIKKNISLGLGQIKVETAKGICHIASEKLVSELLKPEVNIYIVSKLLKQYLDDADDLSLQLKKVVNLYTTGKMNPQNNKELEIYYHLVKWSIENNNFQRTHGNLLSRN